MALATYKWIVTPHALKSFTRMTLLMTSLPRLSNTNTFHIGCPSSLRMGVDSGRNPLACGSCCSSGLRGGSWLRLRIFSIDAIGEVLAVQPLVCYLVYDLNTYPFGDRAV